MKNFILLLLALACNSLSAQIVLTEGYIANNWLMKVQTIQGSKVISKQDVLNPPPFTLPANFMDTLKTYDWVFLGDFYYKSGEWGSDWGKFQRRYEFKRYTPDNRLYSYQGGRNFPNDPAHLAFLDYRSSNGDLVDVVKRNGHYFIRHIDKDNPSSIDHLRIVSYKDGVLVYDCTRSGSYSDIHSYSRFRNVMIAVPKEKGLTYKP